MRAVRYKMTHKAKVRFLCQTFCVLWFLVIDQCSALHRDIANDSTSAKQA